MKKQYLFILILALLAIGCSKENSDALADSFTLEVTIPEGTAASDEVSIAGPCFAENLILSPKYARVRTIEINPGDFVSGKSLEDGFWFESAELGRELDADGSPVTHTMKGAAGYTYQVSVARWTKERVEDLTEQRVSSSWSLVGTMNEWRLSLGLPLTGTGDSRVLKDVNCNGTDAFKLVLDNSWIINYGIGEPNTVTRVDKSSVTLTRDGGSIQPAPGVYTLNFNPRTCVLALDKTGEYIPDPEPDSWAVTGAFNGWAMDTAIPLSLQKNSLYTASYVGLTQATEADGEEAGFLLVKNGSMEGFLGRAGGRGTVSVGSATALEEGGGKMLVPANGYYEFSLDPKNLTVTVSDSPAATQSSWSIVGKFNGWDQTAGIPFYTYGTWHVAKNVELTMVNGANDMGFKFVKDKSWDNNRGITGMSGGDGGYKVVDLDTEISLAQGGGNIQLPEEGFYDVYMNAATDKAYILKAGSAFLH